jgi:DNA repair exonuclease SbcCD ATPase subunit
MLPKGVSRFIIVTALAAAIPAFGLYALAQSSQEAPSVAEAARRAREQKEAATKPTHVVTNDTLPAVPNATPNGAVTNSGSETSASSSTGAAESSEKPTVATADGDKKNAELEALKKQIAEAQKAVDLAQRELNLDQDSFLSKPDYQNDQAGKQKLDSLQSEIKDKQDELNALKAKLTEMAAKEPAQQAPANPEPGSSSTPAQPD